MCGRTRCTLDPGLVARATGVPPDKWVDKDKYHPSYNVSPGRFTPILRAKKAADASEKQGRSNNAEEVPSPSKQSADALEDQGPGKDADENSVHTPERFIQCMKWGLVPSFTKKEEKPDFFRMFNARGESIHERSAFRRLLPRSRCVAMVEGFYEWKKDEKSKAKQPYYIHYKEEERPLLLAALCDRWEDAEGNVLHTYTIVTTRVSKALEWLHDRMPAILSSQSEVDTWLQPDMLVEDILKLAKPYEAPDLVWHPVTAEMGKPSFDSPACVKEVTPTSAKTSAIASLFKKVTKADPHAGTSDTQPHLDNLEEEKAFAAGVIPDRDVTKALGKRKDHPDDEKTDILTKAKDEVGEIVEGVKEVAAETVEVATDKLEGAVETARDTAGSVVGTATDEGAEDVHKSATEAVRWKERGRAGPTVGEKGLQEHGEKHHQERREGVHRLSPRSPRKEAKELGKSPAKGAAKGSEPSPKKQKSLTAFFSKA